jgi:hypothetical protein
VIDVSGLRNSTQLNSRARARQFRFPTARPPPVFWEGPIFGPHDDLVKIIRDDEICFFVERFFHR